MDYQGQGDGSNPILIDDDDDDDEGAPAVLATSRGASSASESPMFVEQDDEEDAPGETASPERNSPERESSMFVNQPRATISPDDDNASPEHVEQQVQAEPEQLEVANSPEDEPAQGQGGDAGGYENGNDEREYSHSSSDEGEACTRACVKQAKTAARTIEVLNRRIVAKDQAIDALRQQLSAAKSEIQRLKEKLKKFTGSEGPERESSWQEKLRESLAGNGSYEAAWKSSYMALNMPIDPNMVHPQVRFVAKEGDEDGSSRQSSPSDVASVRSVEEIRSTKPLPDNIIYQILKELLTKDGLVHCFSRLDPFCKPDEFSSRPGLERSSGLRGRFFISNEERTNLSLTHDTENPNTVLAALCVSRKFAFYGIHIFYGTNTFAFSSFGELDRFATGIGAARWQRIQNVELAWVGGKCVDFNLGNGSSKRLNRRTMPLAWFCESSSLKTLCIHISESAKGVIRRSHEPESQKLYMKKKSSGQPNYRMTRSMRNCLGMDYIYQLRGMLWIRVYCLDKEKAGTKRSLAKIRDQSFVIDVERVATQAKVPARFEKTKLENLDPLFPVGASWGPSRQDFHRIRPIYTEDTGYDNRCNDLDHDATSSQGTIEHSSSSDESGDDQDDSDSDSSGPALHSPPRPPRRRRPFTPAPSPGDVEEEELSESEDENHQSVSNDPDQSDSGDSGVDDDDSVEALRHRRLNQFVRDSSQQVSD